MTTQNCGVKLLVDVSDLHCGSRVGLMPPEVLLDDGNVITHGENKVQIFLWEKWLLFWQMVAEIVKDDPFILLINGDIIEGIHHGSQDVVASKKREHSRIAQEVIRPIAARAFDTLLIKGTECHVGDVEMDVAAALGLRPAQDKTLFEVNGCLCDAAHHIGTTSRAYLEATAMSVSAGNARLNSLRAGQRAAQVFLRAHRHCGGHFSDGSATLVITPAWQFLTRHGFKVVPDSIPRPGGAVLDWRGKPFGSLPVVHDIQFNPPQDDIIVY